MTGVVNIMHGATQFKSSAVPVLLRLAIFMSPGIDTIHLYQCCNENKSTKSLFVFKTPSHDVRRM